MTTPNGTPSMKVVELPQPTFPVLTRVISKPFFNDREEGVTWKLGEAHPLMTDMKVIRMFADQDYVEIYSVPTDKGVHYTRNRIPLSSIRLTEEAMPLEIFVEELAAAEDGDDVDDDDGDEPGPEDAASASSATT